MTEQTTPSFSDRVISTGENDDSSDQYGKWLSQPSPGNEVVISGLAGKPAECEDMYEFRYNLFNKVNMLTTDGRRWNLDHPEIPKPSGKIPHIEKFDAGYFGIDHKTCNKLDPLVRLMLERSVEAVVDAGFNPSELEGSRTGVYIGCSNSESEAVHFISKLEPHHNTLISNIRSTIARRISYFLKLQGPSHNVDTACSSSIYALEQAYKAIRNGLIEQALVGGVHLCLHPNTTLQFFRLGVLSQSGVCRVFDIHGDGYVRSESAIMVFLQKSKDARRIYARIIHTKTNSDGHKAESISYPSIEVQTSLMREVFVESGVDPEDLSYLEAHGTATKVGDPQEAAAIDQAICKYRTQPLLIGSVKSSIGHSEPGSGFCEVAKVLIIMENGLIPPIINHTAVREGIDALEKGRIKLVTETTALPNDKGIIGVNNFGFGGANAHVLLRWNLKTKTNKGLPSDNLPRLVCVSGRQAIGVDFMLDDIKNRDLDTDYVKLYHQIFSREFKGHLARGYSILTTNKELARVVVDVIEPRPLFLFFSTFGSTWSTVAKDLFGVAPIAASINRINDILSAKKVSIVEIILGTTTKETRSAFEQILGNMALQVALADVLKEMGVKPTKVLGSGLGEFLCGYFTNCLTLEQTVLSVYHVALALSYIQNNLTSFLIKVNETELEKLPPNVNLKEITGDGVVVIGESDHLVPFKENLVNQGVDVQELDDCPVDFYSDNFTKIKLQLAKTLESIIIEPKQRNWLSCCSINHSASAAYFLNSLSSVFSAQDLLKNAGQDAVILEIGNGQLKRGSPRNNRYLNFEGNNRTSNLLTFLKHLGSLHNWGQNLDLALLYPEVKYPVGRGTPMISPILKWNHSKDWPVVKYNSDETGTNKECKITVSANHETWKYVRGHVIDGRNLFPATGYITLVWQAFTSNKKLLFTDAKVVFENCRFLRATTVPEDRDLEFLITIQNGTGKFEVVESNTIVVSGRIYSVDHNTQEQIDIEFPSIDPESLAMSSKDVYKELRLRGYNYSGSFRSIKQANLEGTSGLIRWDDNWVTFMDNMMQLTILPLDTRLLYVPVSIEKLVIDPKEHLAKVKELGEGVPFTAYAPPHSKTIKSGGIEIRGLVASPIIKKKITEEPVLEKYQFVPDKAKLDINEAVIVNVQLLLENSPGTKVKVVEVIDEETPDSWEPLAPQLRQALSNLPAVQADVTILSKKTFSLDKVAVEDRKLTAESDCSIVVGTNLLERPKALAQFLTVLKEGGCILSRQLPYFNTKQLNLPHINILTTYTSDNETLVMIKKPSIYTNPTYVEVSDLEGFSWLPTIKKALTAKNNVVVYVQNSPVNGILGLVNCIRREPGTQHVKCVFVDDPKAPEFDPQLPFYRNQLEKGLAINVYKNGSWGSYRHLLVGELDEVEREHCFVNTLVRGDFSTLRWIEGPLRSDSVTKSGLHLIHVYYSGMNFRDIMSASGKLSADSICKYRPKQEILQGYECSGRTVTGERVMALVNCGAHSTLVEANIDMTWPVPDCWTLEEASTVLLVYCTLIYGMFMRTRLKPGNTILIHSGTGGVGLSAIRLALSQGCTVFTTVGTPEKREFIRKTFPSISDSHIGNSRDSSFEQMVLTQTNGRGVDFVLNSLADEKLLVSIRCLAPGGHFLEIGKFDLSNNSELRLELLKKEATFHGIMLDIIFESPTEVKQELKDQVSKYIKKGVIKPLMTTVFEHNQIEEVFRYMSSGKHMGKVVIKIREEEQDKCIKPSKMLMKGIRRYFCEPDKTYVIVGGLGGFGLELADWLILRGATRLVLTSRKGVRTGYQAYRLRCWKGYNAKVEIRTDDVQTPEGCRNLLEAANTLGPVGGIFNLAVLLLDALLENQTQENFKRSFASKAYATEHLDQISRQICPHLRNFVVFSSISCGRGNAGQTNYGMANSVMERICERRKASGLPALAIEWGAIGDVGIVADMQEEDVQLEIGGTLQQRITSCLQVMDVLMCQDSPVVASMVVAKGNSSSGQGNTLVEIAANILGIKDLKKISFHMPLPDLGMDSMGAVELRQTMEREFQIFLSPQELRKLTFTNLEEMDSEQLSVQEQDQEPSFNKIEMLIRDVTAEGVASLRSIKMETKAKDTTSPSQILLFPGVEGMAKSLEPLAQNLNVAAISLQFGYDEPKSSIREIALNLLPAVEQLLPSTGPFHFVAYSHGVSVALDLVNLLEEKGRTGHLLCLDGGPEHWDALLKSQLGTDEEATFQTNLLIQFMSLIIPYSTILEYRNRLLVCQNFEQRLAICEKLVPADSTHTKIHIGKIVTALFSRISVLRNSQRDYKLKSPVKLYKPSQSLVHGLSEDYELSSLCQEPVQIRVFEGNHVTLLENNELALAIDQFAALE